MRHRLLLNLLCFVFIHTLCLSKTERYSVPPPEFFTGGDLAGTLKIAPGDTLSLRFYYNPELNKIVKVREDGKISVDLFQGLSVAGETPEELQKQLVQLYSREFTNPEITVDVATRAGNEVYVTGEVFLAGAKELRADMTVALALALSQVSQKTAGTKSVFLMRRAEQGKYRVYKVDASFPGGNGRDIRLMGGDILFVPRKGIVVADDAIEQYVRQILPLQSTGSIGLYYTPATASLVNTTTTH